MTSIDVPEQMSWSALAQLLGDEVATRLRDQCYAAIQWEDEGGAVWPVDRPMITTYPNYPKE